MMEGSLSVFLLGWLSFLPLIGLGFGAVALRRFFSVWALVGKEFNPARFYLYAGLKLAFLGSLVSMIIILGIAAAVVDAM